MQIAYKCLRCRMNEHCFGDSNGAECQCDCEGEIESQAEEETEEE